MTGIPARLVVGVTGHRRLEPAPHLVERIDRAIEMVEGLVPVLKNTPVSLTVLSSLAEGADRLVAERVLAVPGAKLEVVLPLAREDYTGDFAGPGSAADFNRLIERADVVRQLPPAAIRAKAYALAGRFVADRCDVLIALWDGRPENGEGGTAEIVRYARERKCPLVWIDPAPGGEVRFEPGRGLNAAALRRLDEFNTEQAGEGEIDAEVRKALIDLRESASAAGFAAEQLERIGRDLLARRYQADLLARRCRRLYLRAGSLVYTLATLAVATAAFQALFLPDKPRIALVELLFISAALAIVTVGNRRRWLEKWIDDRFLAERFRSALFMALAGIDLVTLRLPRHLSLAFSPRDWMVEAFLSVWRGVRAAAPPPSELEGLKRFIVEAWIDDQITYHRRLAVRHRRRHARLAFAAYFLSGVSFLAVLAHAVAGSPRQIEHILVFLAVVAPAAAGAVGAIRAHREYLKNSLRSAEMARHLAAIRERMISAAEMGAFLALVAEAEEIMLNENADWRVVVRFHELEPTA